MDSTLALALTGRIAAGYFKGHAVPLDRVITVISTIGFGVRHAGDPEPARVPPKPAVPVSRSIETNYLICLEDGKRVKFLNRHLRQHYNMSPDEYRRKWKLPPEYPMAPAGYCAQRAEFAKQTGLGTKHHRARALRRRQIRVKP